MVKQLLEIEEREMIYEEIEDNMSMMGIELDYYKSMHNALYEPFGSIKTIINIKKKYKDGKYKEFINQILRPLGKLIKDNVSIIGNKKYKVINIVNGSCTLPAYKQCDGSLGCYQGSCCSSESKLVKNFIIDDLFAYNNVNYYNDFEIKDNILIITCKYHSYPDREREYIPFRITLREEAFSNI